MQRKSPFSPERLAAAQRVIDAYKQKLKPEHFLKDFRDRPSERPETKQFIRQFRSQNDKR